MRERRSDITQIACNEDRLEKEKTRHRLFSSHDDLPSRGCRLCNVSFLKMSGPRLLFYEFTVDDDLEIVILRAANKIRIAGKQRGRSPSDKLPSSFLLLSPPSFCRRPPTWTTLLSLLLVKTFPPSFQAVLLFPPPSPSFSPNRALHAVQIMAG